MSSLCDTCYLWNIHRMPGEIHPTCPFGIVEDFWLYLGLVVTKKWNEQKSPDVLPMPWTFQDELYLAKLEFLAKKFGKQ